MKHRGRIQAQGENLEASKSWSQENPPTKSNGFEMVNSLKDKIPKKEDGSLYFDGNPVFNMKLDNSNRAVGIIQEEIETNNVEFSAWLNTIEIENQQIDELVICLELSQESVLHAIELINSWLVNNLSKIKMEKYIDKLFSIKETIFNSSQLQNEKEFV